jgi:cytochrome c-type biogenesis protein CcmF
MLPELGHFALILGLAFAIIQFIFPLLGVLKKNEPWQNLAKPAALGQFLFIAMAFALLTYAFVINDFSVAYVAQNSNTHLPLPYRIAAVWGAHEGSILLWITILAIWTALVACFSKQLPKEISASVLAVLGFISSGFLLFLLLTSDPFNRLFPSPLQGADLNPLLQDPGLAIHPPMLYMGYVGFSVAFAFAIAALINGKLDAAWARWSRPWTIAAWCFLTWGITLGSWWSYRVLGWGGWWAWDPVENASFLPWLAGTALIHSLIVTEKRGAFKSWTVLLSILPFSLSLMGTFLVRSGVLVSIHAFANDPSRGAYLLEFLGLVIGSALLLYAIRAPLMQSSKFFSLLSRETFLLANNILLIVAMTTILIGTLYPLILSALNLGKISVGAPYFNTVFTPLIIPVLFLMGIAPFCYWRENNATSLARRLFYPFIFSIILSSLLLFIFTKTIPIRTAIGLGLACWIILTTGKIFISQLKSQDKILLRNQLSMILAHIGMAICVIGITLSNHYKLSREVSMQIGDTAKVGSYYFQFMGIKNIIGPNYKGISGEFRVTQHHHYITTLNAQKRIYTAEQTEMTKAAIEFNLWRDLYIALGDPLNNNAWVVRIYDKPFVRWIWWGGLMMVLGGLATIGRKSTRKSRADNHSK